MKGSKEKVPPEGFGIPPVARWRAGWFLLREEGNLRLGGVVRRYLLGRRPPLLSEITGSWPVVLYLRGKRNVGRLLPEGLALAVQAAGKP